MKELERHEQLEMLILNEMRKIKILDQLIFGGGTMLRLCYDLPRFSVDFDFYLKKSPQDFLPWAKRLTQMYENLGAKITDHHEKKFTFIWEVKMAGYPRRLKTEIRKETEESQKTELNIAHSQFSEIQVRLRTLTLEQMWLNKVRALTDRREIRDAFDLEFLTRRGFGNFIGLSQEQLKKMEKQLEGFTSQDFKVTLGSVLKPEDRAVALNNRFSYLKSKMREALTESLEKL